MSTPVTPADNSVAYIRKKIRRLTASSSESALSTADIDQYINRFYENDFAYGIKVDQMRSVYTFYTTPYIDKYPLNVNFNQGIRSPVYFEGVQGTFFKDRMQFYNMFPRWPTQFTPASGDGVTALTTFTIPGPFLRNEVVLGGVASGVTIHISDDGEGNLILNTANPVVTVPPYTDVYTALNAPVPALVGKPIPGMHNQNTLNPGDQLETVVGTVNYVTGVFTFTSSIILDSGTVMNAWVSQYSPGRPYTLLFWNNYFQVRPVPNNVYKVEVETYLTPVEFMNSTDSPILNQWVDYIAIGAAIKVLEDRNDTQGIQNLSVIFDRQESLVLERQAVEEINQRNSTIYSASTPQPGWNLGQWYY